MKSVTIFCFLVIVAVAYVNAAGTTACNPACPETQYCRGVLSPSCVNYITLGNACSFLLDYRCQSGLSCILLRCVNTTTTTTSTTTSTTPVAK